MSSYFIRQKGSAFVVIALLLLFAAACVTDPGAVLISLQKAGTTDDGLAYGPEDIIATVSLYTSDAADERSSVDLGGRRIIKKKKTRT